jgi:non-heme chloroperoxidase
MRIMIDSSVELVTTPDGVHIAVHEWGNPSGAEVLLIHGVAQSHLCFARQTDEALTRQCRIVAYDVRGHGGSDKPLDAVYYHDAGRWADEVQAVIRAKSLRKPVLVGWSMGGRIIGQYLLVCGDAGLSGLNFVGARAVPNPAFSGPGSARVPRARPNDIGSQIASAAAFLRACYERQPSEAEFATALAYNMVTPPEVRAALMTWPSSIPVTNDALRKVRVPTLVTHGRADSVVLPAAAEHTAALIQGSTISWYDGCGHSPFFEDASRFNRELAAFAVAAWR